MLPMLVSSHLTAPFRTMWMISGIWIRSQLTNSKYFYAHMTAVAFLRLAVILRLINDLLMAYAITRSKEMKTGLIVEGGGMKCAYSAGVLDIFLDEGIQFDYCIGVSAGAANSASFLAGAA